MASMHFGWCTCHLIHPRGAKSHLHSSKPPSMAWILLELGLSAMVEMISPSRFLQVSTTRTCSRYTFPRFLISLQLILLELSHAEYICSYCSSFQGLDFVVSEARKYGIYLILSLVNNFKDYGGRSQYVEWARERDQQLSDDDGFYTNSVVKEYYKNHVKVTHSSVLYRPLH